MKKIYSLFIALLVAGSMMGTVVSIDFSQQGYENEQVISSVALDEHTFVSFDYTYAKHPAKYYNYGTAVRVYPGSDILIEFNEFNVYKITRVVLEYGEGDPGNELKPLIGNFDGSTWTGKRESVKFTVGGSTGHRRIKKVTVTYNEDSSDPGNYIDPSAELDAGFGYAISLRYALVRNPEVYGEWMSKWAFYYEAGTNIIIHVTNYDEIIGSGYGNTRYWGENSCYIEESGYHWIYFRVNEDGDPNDGWCNGSIKMVRLDEAPDPENLLDALIYVTEQPEEGPYKNGKQYTFEGYVTNVREYSASHHDISFDISDEPKGDSYVLAFRAACPKASHVVEIGDKVRITGPLEKYGSNTAEIMKGTYEILNREEVDPEPSHEGLEDTDALIRPMKTIRNGQLLIERNGKLYNVSGAEVK